MSGNSKNAPYSFENSILSRESSQERKHLDLPVSKNYGSQRKFMVKPSVTDQSCDNKAYEDVSLSDDVIKSGNSCQNKSKFSDNNNDLPEIIVSFDDLTDEVFFDNKSKTITWGDAMPDEAVQNNRERKFSIARRPSNFNITGPQKKDTCFKISVWILCIIIVTLLVTIHWFMSKYQTENFPLDYYDGIIRLKDTNNKQLLQVKFYERINHFVKRLTYLVDYSSHDNMENLLLKFEKKLSIEISASSSQSMKCFDFHLLNTDTQYACIYSTENAVYGGGLSSLLWKEGKSFDFFSQYNETLHSNMIPLYRPHWILSSEVYFNASSICKENIFFISKIDQYLKGICISLPSETSFSLCLNKIDQKSNEYEDSKNMSLELFRGYHFVFNANELKDSPYVIYDNMSSILSMNITYKSLTIFNWQKYEGDLQFDTEKFINLSIFQQFLKQNDIKLYLPVSDIIDLKSKNLQNISNILSEKDESLSDMQIYSNQDKSKSFVGIRAGHSHEFANWLITRLNPLISSFGVESFIPHMCCNNDEVTESSQSDICLKCVYNDVSTSLSNIKQTFCSHHSHEAIDIYHLPIVESSYQGLQDTLDMVIQLSISDIRYFAAGPVGGLSLLKSPSPDLYLKWLNLAIFFPIIQFHLHLQLSDESISLHAENALKFRDNVLVPLILKSTQFNDSVIAPVWSNSDNKLPHYSEFMFANKYLVVPSIKPNQSLIEVYFPSGKWLHQSSKKSFVGVSYHTFFSDNYQILFFEKIE